MRRRLLLVVIGGGVVLGLFDSRDIDPLVRFGGNGLLASTVGGFEDDFRSLSSLSLIWLAAFVCGIIGALGLTPLFDETAVAPAACVLVEELDDVVDEFEVWLDKVRIVPVAT